MAWPPPLPLQHQGAPWLAIHEPAAVRERMQGQPLQILKNTFHSKRTQLALGEVVVAQHRGGCVPKPAPRAQQVGGGTQQRPGDHTVRGRRCAALSASLRGCTASAAMQRGLSMPLQKAVPCCHGAQPRANRIALQPPRPTTRLHTASIRSSGSGAASARSSSPPSAVCRSCCSGGGRARRAGGVGGRRGARCATERPPLAAGLQRLACLVGSGATCLPRPAAALGAGRGAAGGPLAIVL